MDPREFGMEVKRIVEEAAVSHAVSCWVWTDVDIASGGERLYIRTTTVTGKGLRRNTFNMGAQRIGPPATSASFLLEMIRNDLEMIGDTLVWKDPAEFVKPPSPATISDDVIGMAEAILAGRQI